MSLTEPKVCNICGATEFKKVPSRRDDPVQPPVCAGCGALERHRVFRAMFEAMGPENFKEWSCLQFSLDPSIDATWFASRTVSIYNHRNSLDLERIDKPDHSYDVVVCNHVIEHVADDRAAIRELCRVTKPSGFVFLSTPQPKNRHQTRDWGFPKPEEHGHYRVYGMDILDKLRSEAPRHNVSCLWGTDPVTETRDVAFVLTECPDLPMIRPDMGVAVGVSPPASGLSG